MNNILDKDRWGEIIQALSAKPTRTIITAFGVCWGIFILILLLSASNGLENGVKRGFEGLAVNSAVIWGQSTTKAYGGFSLGRKVEMKNEDLSYLRTNFPQIRYISSGNWNNGTVMNGLKKGQFTINGNNPEIINQLPYKIKKGRFLNFSDVEKKSKIAIISETILNEIFEPFEDPIGKTITINGISFLVVGVYQDNSPWGDKRSIIIPFTTSQQIYNLGNLVSNFFITANDGTPVTDVKIQLETALKKIHKIHPDDERAFGGFNLYEMYKQTTDLFTVLKLVSYLVGVLILLSGIIGITNIMLIVVKERTKEIGIRRALGATPKVVIRQILTESMVLTVIAGMVGVILSTGVVILANTIIDSMPDKDQIPFTNPTVDLGVISIAFAILIGAGLLAGYVPARIAIKIKPIDALRDE